MRLPKRYGEYKTDRCPFCDSTATVKNEQGVPVCVPHRKELLEGLKCSCGSWLDIKTGKYGVFFNCINCGNINYRKGLELNGYPLKGIEEL